MLCDSRVISKQYNRTRLGAVATRSIVYIHLVTSINDFYKYSEHS